MEAGLGWPALAAHRMQSGWWRKNVWTVSEPTKPPHQIVHPSQWGLSEDVIKWAKGKVAAEKSRVKKQKQKKKQLAVWESQPNKDNDKMLW